MPGNSKGASAEALLEHARWIRALARHLVRDAELASDLEQETWMRALEKPPRVDRPVRGWLATVMRNLVRQRRRVDARRDERERRAAREERLDPSDAIVERAQAHRRLVDAVLALEEPYRATLLARYFEELSPAEIARRLGAPLPTVKTRLARGLERLRERLDHDAARDRQAWIVWLAPLAAAPSGAAAAPALLSALVAVLVVNVKILLAVLVLAAGVALYFSWPSAPTPGPSTPIARAPVTDASPVASAAAPDAPASGGGRAAADAAPARRPDSLGSAPAAAAKETKAPRKTRGRVIDVGSRAVSDIEVRASSEVGARGAEGFASPPGAPTARTDADGRFEIELRESVRTLVAEDASHVTVFPAVPVDASTGREATVVIAPRIEVSGRVIDESGAPVAGALIALAMPQMLRGQLAANLDYSDVRAFECASDAEGRFSLRPAPAVRDARLRVSTPGFPIFDEPAPQTSEGDRTIVLRRAPLEGTVLRGRVLGPSNAPVHGASVSLGLDVTTSDAEGRFSFDLASAAGYNAMLAKMDAERNPGKPPRAHGSVIAVKAGHLPARFDARPGKGPGGFDWPELVELRLRGEPMSIAGRVVAPDGSALPGVLVWVADPTFFGGIGDASTGRPPQLMHVENLLSGSQESWRRITTGENGRFRIDGLTDRAYAIEAMETATLLRGAARDVRAGTTDLTIVMPRDDVYGSLRGRVLSKKGKPVAGVSVSPMCDAFRMRIGGEVVGTSHLSAEGVTTDEEGRFELKTVPKNLVYLRLDGPHTLPLEWGRHVEGGMAKLVGKDPDAVTIRVDLRCHFQVELANTDEADEIGILDGDGQPLEISEFRGRSRREGARQRLTQGRSEKLAASDAAATIVLYREGVEIRRARIELAPGDTKTIRP